MNLQHVKDFLSSVKDGSKTKIIEILENDQQMIGQIIQFLMTHQSNEFADVVYSSLFTLYQNGGDVEKSFVLHFLPALVWEYLFVSSNHGRKGYGKLEAVLLAIYNAEIVDEHGKTKYQTFRLPSLSRPSIYHELSLGKSGTSALTESALSRHEQSEVVYRLDGPAHKLTRIPACHRFAVIAFVLEQYNSYIAFMGEASLEAACKMALLTASCGFKDLCIKKSDVGKDLEELSECSRIPLDNASLVQLVYIVYFALYNGFFKRARVAFDALHFRAEYGLFSQAYLLTRSIEHIMESNDDDVAPSGLDMSKLSDCSVQTLPKCLNGKSIPWKRRPPYEILLVDRPVPSYLELDETFASKLKLSKDGRPKKAKSWANVSSGKPSPSVTSAKSPSLLETPSASNTPTGTRVEHFEMVTGV